MEHSMKRRPRRNHSAAFKAKVALAAVRGERSSRGLLRRHPGAEATPESSWSRDQHQDASSRVRLGRSAHRCGSCDVGLLRHRFWAGAAPGRRLLGLRTRCWKCDPRQPSRCAKVLGADFGASTRLALGLRFTGPSPDWSQHTIGAAPRGRAASGSPSTLACRAPRRRRECCRPAQRERRCRAR